VIDNHGSVMTGQPLTYSSSVTSVGTISSGGLFTSAGQAGSTVITAMSGTLTSSLTVTVNAAPAAAATINDGNNQHGFVREALPVNPSVLVKDKFGTPIPGVDFTFTVTQGGGSVGFATVTSSASGIASTPWILGKSVGHNRMAVTAQGFTALSFDADGDSPYNIEVVYRQEVSTSERSAVDAAIAHWKKIITTDIGTAQFDALGGGCAGFSIAPNEIIRGLRVYVKDSAVAGSTLLAQSGPCYINSVSKFPVVSVIVWNTNQTAYIQQNSLGEIIATHEFAHAMGFGTTWTTKSLLAGSGTSDPYFTGFEAVTAFSNSFGAGYVGNAVPVEATGSAGTAGSHWRESVFNRELMTGFVNAGTPNPLSAVTIASFADLGYTVDVSQAEVFTGSVLMPGAPTSPQSRREIGDDIYRQPIGLVAPRQR
jgi:hypothetical protein